ncbi:MAG: hypothetical protein ABI759_26860 [Candidatus Solibacter sp.]
MRIGEIQEATFLPGVHAASGILLVNLDRLLWPGDLLHEAGHLALLTPEARREAEGNVGNDGGDEMGAIAWSYAAALHLNLDPAVVFHAGGYQGGSEALLANFTAGHYLGVPVLEWRGLCLSGQRAAETGAAPYPHMLRWLRV